MLSQEVFTNFGVLAMVSGKWRSWFDCRETPVVISSPDVCASNPSKIKTLVHEVIVSCSRQGRVIGIGTSLTP